MDLTNLNKDRKGIQRRSTIDISSMVYGKVPPQATALEEMILGAIMLEKNAFDIISGILKPGCFYKESHNRIYDAICRMQMLNMPIDIEMVCVELRKSDELDIVGGPFAVTRITNSVVSSAHIEAHARIVIQKFMAREVIRVSGEMLNAAYEESTDIFTLLEYSEEAVLSIGTKHLHGDMVSIDNVLIQGIKKIEKYRKQDRLITGVPSGFPKIDRATRGWQPSNLIILAARPSVGKTAFALNLAKNAAHNTIEPVDVAFWSLEMDAVQLIFRMLASESNTYLQKIQTGQLDDAGMKKLYQEGIDKLAKDNIFFDDVSGLTLFTLRSKARRLKKKHPKLGLIIIDYLQLMTAEGKGTREQEVSSISRGLKALSRELKIPIIALSQLSRAMESRTGKRREPQLSDLRESGSIEQDADMVMFLWGADEEEIEKDPSLINKRWWRIAKQRDGVLAREEFTFRNEIQLFIPSEEEKGYKPIQTDLGLNTNPF